MLDVYTYYEDYVCVEGVYSLEFVNEIISNLNETFVADFGLH